MWQGSYEFIVNQWGVGHGGFHSQSVFFQTLARSPTARVGKGTRLHVIYDCGSGRGVRPGQALTDAVARMLDRVMDPPRTIDLLVISHFDQDHVNGLPYLAAELNKRKIKVTRVWAPVLTKIEALFAISSSDLTGPALRAYAALLDDPPGQLAGLFGDAEVTQMAPNDEPIPLPTIEAGVGESSDSDDGRVFLAGVPGGRGLVARPGAGGTGASLAGEALWEFQPYVIESTLVGAAAVAATVRKLVGKPVEQCSIDDLIRFAKDRTFLAAFHLAVKNHHSQLSPTKRASSGRTGPNLSSLCVYSGPVSPYDWCHFRSGGDSISVTPWAIPIAPAWLGTGDAGLRDAGHVDAMRVALTQSRLDRVGICSAPHHGSKHDSGTALWDSLPNARFVTIEANHLTGGTGNQHPHNQVLAELRSRNLAARVATVGVDFRRRDKRIR